MLYQQFHNTFTGIKKVAYDFPFSPLRSYNHRLEIHMKYVPLKLLCIALRFKPKKYHQMIWDIKSISFSNNLSSPEIIFYQSICIIFAKIILHYNMTDLFQNSRCFYTPYSIWNRQYWQTSGIDLKILWSEISLNYIFEYNVTLQIWWSIMDISFKFGNLSDGIVSFWVIEKSMMHS